ncbi:phospholipase D-like domain-containing protein [Thioclava sp.]|uniref:phospholipase D-like domain-containing protein n=1 Tax=Thioclava sp. TaxID=1933450 RepID=UPI003AA9885E
MERDLIHLVLWALLAGVITLIALTLVVARLSHRRPRGPFASGQTLIAPESGVIAQALRARLADAPKDKSAVQLLADPVDAFAARLELIAAAEVSLDLQYYIWQNDTAGALMLRAVREAAARGVRVRLLIDDNGTAGMDRILAALDQMPEIEVRLFNPFPIRRARVLGYLSDFRRLNRRMHNKAMVADGRIAILGGRNIGDDYFDPNSESGLFMDMDVAVSGPIVPTVCEQFDLYWNAIPAIPARLMLGICPEAEAAALLQKAELRLSASEARTYRDTLQASERSFAILGADAKVILAEAQLIYDPPAKIRGMIRGRKLLWQCLIGALGQPSQELLLITPYLVPTRTGVRLLRRIARTGVTIKVLTNSYATTDVPIVHSGYAHRRRAMLRAGLELYEYAPDAEAEHARGMRPGQFMGSAIKGTSPFSRNKLHAKVFAVDRARVFIGSFNLDPRSMRLNTELGVVISAPEIAERISDSFAQFIPERAWQVRLSRAQRLRWSRPGQPELKREPGVPRTHRVFLAIAQRLPIEWML